MKWDDVAASFLNSGTDWGWMVVHH